MIPNFDPTKNFIAFVTRADDGTVDPADDHALEQICTFIDEAAKVGCVGNVHTACVLKMLGMIGQIEFPSGGVAVFSHVESNTRVYLVDNNLSLIESFIAIMEAKNKADSALKARVVN